jgi:hypothetical protein
MVLGFRDWEVVEMGVKAIRDQKINRPITDKGPQ